MLQPVCRPSSGTSIQKSYQRRNNWNLRSQLFTVYTSYYVRTQSIHSFHWHVQSATIPCGSQELLLFLSVMYFFLPPFSTNYSSILPQFILPSISWSTSQPHCFQIHTYFFFFFGNSIFFHSLYVPKPT